MDKVILYSSQVFLSEENTNPDSYIAKFIICDFGRNKNGVALDREHIEEWLATLNNKPLVGKIKMRYDGEYDFSGHNMKVVTKKDENGNKYKDVIFDTSAFGSFFNVAVETIDGKDYIVASCEIWKRFSQACDIIIKRIEEGTLYTSWEISVEKSRQGIIDGMATKIIELGRFMGHCLLSKYTEPAYDSSCLLEIASTNEEDAEITDALSQDFMSQELSINNPIDKEENELAKKTIETEVSEEIEVTIPAESTEEVVAEVVEPVVETPEVTEPVTETSETSEETPEEPTTETSALTVHDLRCRIAEACTKAYGDWCYVAFWFPEEHTVWCDYCGKKSDLDFLLFTYEVADDEVTVSEPVPVSLAVSISEVNKVISEKDDALVKANETIQNLENQVSALQPFKDAADKAELEKAEAEKVEKKNNLKTYAMKSGFISEEEMSENAEIAEMVENLNEAGIKAIIAERFMASLSGKVETSSVETASTVSVDLNSEENENNISINPVQAYLN